MRRVWLLGLVGLVVVVLPGCPWFIPPYAWIEPEVDVSDKALLVVPFSDAENSYFASADGNLLAQMVIEEVRRGAPKTRLVDPEEVRRLFTGRELEAVGWKTVAQAVGADYVLVGRIDTLSLRDPGNPNLYLGTVALALKVVAAADGSIVWSATPAEARYRWSATGHPDVGTPVFDVTEEQVRRNTLLLAARRIGDVFCRRRVTRAAAQRRQRAPVRMLRP